MTVPRRLRHRLVAAVGVGAVAFGGIAVAIATNPTAWLVGAVGVGSVVAVTARLGLGSNRTPESSRIHDRLGAANAVTLFRGWLLAALAGFLVADPADPWLPAGLFVAAGILDAVDGAVARRTRETVLGARLDTSVDALAVLVGSAVGVAGGVLPMWYLLAGFVWYVYTAGLWYRRRTGTPVYDLPESRLRPVVGAAQLVVIGGALLPLFGTPETTAASTLALAALCLSFGRDWAAATGRIES